MITSKSRQVFYRHQPAEVLGVSTDGTEACVELPDGAHEHIDPAELTTIQYPNVTVHMSTGQDGSTGAIMGTVTDALRRAGYSPAARSAFRQAVFGCESYDAVLQLVMRTVNVT